MSNSVGQIDLDLQVNQAGFNNQLNRIGSNAGGMLSGVFMKLGGVIAATFALTALAKFGSGCITLASDLNEVQNVVDVTFSSMTNQVNNFSKTALQSFGLSELSAKKFASTMGAMLKSSGLAGQEMTNMSLGITGLAGDMASFYNLKPEEAFNKIRAGISGETEPLKQLGVNMSVANMEAFALAQGITTSYQKMSQANQSLLRYNYLLSVTKDAQGDFVRTSGTWANQVRILGEQWNIFKGTLGQGFMNMMTPVLAGLNALIVKLQVAAQYFTAFTALIFGSAAAKGSAAGAAAIANAAAANKASGANDKLAGSTAKVGEASKKAAAAIKGSLSGFDQLNVIGKDASDSLDDASGDMGGMDSGGGGVVPEIAFPTVDTSGMQTMLQPLKDILDAIIKPLQDINFEPLLSAFGRLKEALTPLGVVLFEGLKWGYENVLVPLATWTIEQALPAFLDLVSSALNLINPILEVFKPLALFLLNEFLIPIAAFTGGVIVQVLKDITLVLTDIGVWIGDNTEPIRTAGKVVAGFFLAWKLTEVLAFIQLSGGLIGALKNVTLGIYASVTALGKQALAAIASKLETMALTTMYAVDFVVGIGKATAAILVNAAETIALKILYGIDMVKAIAASIVSMAAQVVQWGLNTAATIANKVAMIAGTIAQVAMTVAMGVWSVACGVGTVVTWAFNAAMAVLTSPITLVIAAIVALVTGIVLLVKNWDTVKEVAANVWESIKNVWKSAATWFGTNVVDPIAKVFKGLWNGIVDGMNWVINGMNKIKVDLPDWIPGIGGKTFGISLPNIPRLANGGLVSSPTLAMVGDNKNATIDPEVISPLSKLQDIMGGGNQVVVEALMMVLDAIEKLNLSVELDGEKLGRTLYPYVNKEKNRIGNSSIITVGGV